MAAVSALLILGANPIYNALADPQAAHTLYRRRLRIACASGADRRLDQPGIGISKRTLYNYFPSKDDLIVAYLSRRLRPIEVSDRPPAEQILEDFNRLEMAMRSDGYRGCPFMNAVAELADPTHAGHRIAVAHKAKRRNLFRKLLIHLHVADPDVLATQLMILGEGAVAQALVHGDPKMARAARDAACVLLSAAGVQVSAITTSAGVHLPKRGAARGVSGRRIQ